MVDICKIQGPELHRLKPTEEYDTELFMRMYKACEKYIKKLVYGVDENRFGVSRDIVESYFWDKFTFVFFKYHKVQTEAHLKSTLLHSLSTFKNKLLSQAYTEAAEFNQKTSSLDMLFDNSKEDRGIDGEKDDDETDDIDVQDSEQLDYWEDKEKALYDFLKTKLTPDEILLMQVETNPPKWFDIHCTTSRITIQDLINFFGLPKDRKSRNIISAMRNHIQEALLEAKEHFTQKEPGGDHSQPGSTT